MGGWSRACPRLCLRHRHDGAGHRLSLRLGLATPISIMVAVGKAAQKVFSSAMATLCKPLGADLRRLDNTGTVTEGAAADQDRERSELTEEQVLQWAATETGSEHPLAAAILTAAAEKNCTLLPVTDSRRSRDMASRGSSRISRVAGNLALMTEQGVDCGRFADRLTELAGEGQTPVLLASTGPWSDCFRGRPDQDGFQGGGREVEVPGCGVLMVTETTRSRRKPSRRLRASMRCARRFFLRIRLLS